MMDFAWQLEALASIITCVALGLAGRRAIRQLDQRREAQTRRPR